MKNIALVIGLIGVTISYLAFLDGHIEIGSSISSSVLAGYYGYLQKKKEDKSSPEAILTIFIFLLCILSYFCFKDSFLNISSVLNSSITGYFGVSIGSASTKNNMSKI
jgi:xanthine/uracil permease